MPESKKKSGGSKKIGRNAAKCKNYRLSGKRERARIKKISRHLKWHGGAHRKDLEAKSALKAYGGTP